MITLVVIALVLLWAVAYAIESRGQNRAAREVSAMRARGELPPLGPAPTHVGMPGPSRDTEARYLNWPRR